MQKLTQSHQASISCDSSIATVSFLGNEEALAVE